MQNKRILDPAFEKAVALQTDVFESAVWTHWLKATTIANSALSDSLKESGFDSEYVNQSIQMLLKSSTEDLIEAQLAEERLETPYWAALMLRCSGSDLHLFTELCLSEFEKERELGVALLLGDVCERFSDQCLSTVLKMLPGERSDSVIIQIAYALRKFNFQNRAMYLKSYINSPSVALREAIAFSLAKLDEELSSELLIELASDDALSVRRWAVFGLAHNNSDSRSVRQALVSALEEDDKSIVQDAVFGLAHRQDAIAVGLIARQLESGEITLPILEAIFEFPQPIFAELLNNLKSEVLDEHKPLVEQAIDYCNSGV